MAVGAYTQTATGVTEFQIAGTTPALIGKLVTTAPATLGGTAKVTVVGGFAPSTGQSFPLMSFPSRTGTFAKIEGINVARAHLFEAIYTGTALSLNALANASEPGGADN